MGGILTYTLNKQTESVWTG